MQKIHGHQILTTQEVADYLRVTTATIYRLVHDGTLPAVKIGRIWRFSQQVLDDWLAQQSFRPSVENNENEQ